MTSSICSLSSIPSSKLFSASDRLIAVGWITKIDNPLSSVFGGAANPVFLKKLIIDLVQMQQFQRRVCPSSLCLMARAEPFSKICCMVALNLSLSTVKVSPLPESYSWVRSFIKPT